MCDEINMNKRQIYAAATACICVAGALAAPRATGRGLAHPELWPRTQSAGLLDGATETFVASLMAGLRLEVKAVQLVATDVAHINPPDQLPSTRAPHSYLGPPPPPTRIA